MCLKFGFAIFWQKDFGAKAAHKMLVKLTPGCKNQTLFFRPSNGMRSPSCPPTPFCPTKSWTRQPRRASSRCLTRCPCFFFFTSAKHVTVFNVTLYNLMPRCFFKHACLFCQCFNCKEIARWPKIRIYCTKTRPEACQNRCPRNKLKRFIKSLTLLPTARRCQAERRFGHFHGLQRTQINHSRPKRPHLPGVNVIKLFSFVADDEAK